MPIELHNLIFYTYLYCIVLYLGLAEPYKQLMQSPKAPNKKRPPPKKKNYIYNIFIYIF